MSPGPHEPDDVLRRPDAEAGETGALGDAGAGGAAGLDRAVHEFVEELRRLRPEGTDGMG